MLNEALCSALSCPAPHQPFCGTIVPPNPGQESIICCYHCWGKGGSLWVTLLHLQPPLRAQSQGSCGWAQT